LQFANPNFPIPLHGPQPVEVQAPVAAILELFTKIASGTEERKIKTLFQ